MIFIFLVRAMQAVVLIFYNLFIDYVPALASRIAQKYKEDPNYATTLPMIRNFKGIGVGDGYYFNFVIILVGQIL